MSVIYHVGQDMIPGVIPAHVGPDNGEVKEGGDEEHQGQVGGQQGQQGVRLPLLGEGANHRVDGVVAVLDS